MPQEPNSENEQALPGHVASTVGLGGTVPKRGGLRVACILVQETYKPGSQAPTGYLAWHEWAETQHKAGLRQKECGKCGLWRYPQELSTEFMRWEGFTSRGRKVKQMAPVCLKCMTPNVADERQTTVPR